MKTMLRVGISIVSIVVIVILLYLAKKYSYIETIEISIKDGDSYFVVEPYRYDLNQIKKYYTFTNTIRNYKIDKSFKCLYKINLNDTDVICYDGGEYALYSKNVESIDDVKDAVSNKDIKVNKSKKTSKVIKMNKSFAKLLKSF